MEALSNAIAVLVALEARVTELVNPAEAVFDAVKGVVKEAVIVVEHLHGRVTELEQLEARVAALEERLAQVVAHPALSVPDLPSAAGSALLPGSVTYVDDVAAAIAAPVQTDPLAGAPNVAAVFGLDPPSAEISGT